MVGVFKLAKQKAYYHVGRIFKAIGESAKSACPESGIFFKASFLRALEIWVDNTKSQSRQTCQEFTAPEIEDYYRGKILDELLEKLPLVKELALLQEGDGQ